MTLNQFYLAICLILLGGYFFNPMVLAYFLSFCLPIFGLVWALNRWGRR